MSVCCECCVLSGRGLCDELVNRPEESYRLWRVVVCDQETSKTRRLKPATGLWKIQTQWIVTAGKQTNKQHMSPKNSYRKEGSNKNTNKLTANYRCRWTQCLLKMKDTNIPMSVCKCIPIGSTDAGPPSGRWTDQNPCGL